MKFFSKFTSKLPISINIKDNLKQPLKLLNCPPLSLLLLLIIGLNETSTLLFTKHVKRNLNSKSSNNTYKYLGF